MITFPRAVRAIAALATTLAMCGTALGAYPEKPIRIVVTIGPGSAIDTTTRQFATGLSELTKQPVIVENKPGGSSAIGVREVLKAPADGYTLLALSGAIVTMNQFLVKNLGYAPDELAPVAALWKFGTVLVVGPNSPYKTYEELRDALHKKPESVSLGTYAQIYQTGAFRLEKAAKMRFNNIPYNAAGKAVTDVIGGATDALLLEAGAALPLIKDGKLRALAVAFSERLPALPDVPTLAEKGMPGFTIEGWCGVAVSAQTPPEVIKRLQDLALEVGATETFRKHVSDRMSVPILMNAAQVRALIDRETAEHAEILKNFK